MEILQSCTKPSIYSLAQDSDNSIANKLELPVLHLANGLTLDFCGVTAVLH